MGRMHLSEAAEREANKIAMEFANSNDVMQDMSRAYNVDFSNIRVHTDSAADSKVKAAGRDALAQGKDLFFGKGIFESSDPAARGLVAHELAHTMQQGAVAGGEMAVSESAPMGAEQGGFMDWIKGLFGSRRSQPAEQELTSSMIPEAAPAPVATPAPVAAPAPAPTPASKYSGPVRGAAEEKNKVNFMSMHSRAIYELAKAATPEELRTNALLRRLILDDYKQSMAARLQNYNVKYEEGDTEEKKAEKEKMEYTSLTSNIMRKESAGEWKTYLRLLKASVPENMNQEIADNFVTHTAADGTTTDNTDDMLNHIQGRLENDPVMMEILQTGADTFRSSQHFSGRNEHRSSEMMMNTLMLRGITPELISVHNKVPAAKALQKAVGLTADPNRSEAKKGFLSFLRRRR